MDYYVSIGLETHVQLRTKSKIWCGCRNAYGWEPNTNICPICLGYPGTLPVLNREAVRLTVLTGLMLQCRISERSKWDRKNYFYPDMPKNYQISQYDQPLCVEGRLEIDLAGGQKKSIGITRIHLEEDVAKNVHEGGVSLIDFNRAGTPLMEIVSEPELFSADEAFAYLQQLKQILLYGEVSDCNLEEGNIRCDLNCSVRPVGQEELGTKTEIKNMNTFRGVHRALSYEIERQKRELAAGKSLRQETRRWEDEAGVTTAMRSKEYAHDYRYFPEPDLVPVTIEAQQLAVWRDTLPELPQQRRERLIREYAIPEYDAGVLVADKAVADLYEETARTSGNAKAASNWIMTEVLRVLAEREAEVRDLPVSAAALGRLIKLVDDGTLNRTSAKEVFGILVDEGGDPDAIVKERGLVQVTDTGAIEELAVQAIEEHPQSVADYRSGKKAALQFLVGQVMRMSKGKANPKRAAETLQKKLDGE